VDGISAVCTIANKFINDVALYALNKYKVDICMILIPGINRVSFRRDRSSNANLLKVCQTYCNGIGHEYAAGGELTERFLELTKTFKTPQ
jgi:nanoRNase/pAp phosphatase (c-di-AMP/oligoRNAs hydrolase)